MQYHDWYNISKHDFKVNNGEGILTKFNIFYTIYFIGLST